MTGQQNDPNWGVVMEQIRGIVAEQARLATQMTALAEDLKNAYVPKGTYDAHREAYDRRFKELEKDNENAQAFRRQVAAGFIVGFLLILLPLLGTINAAIGGK